MCSIPFSGSCSLIEYIRNPGWVYTHILHALAVVNIYTPSFLSLAHQTPLHLAAITAQPALVKLLLAHGASPMVLDRNGQTALHLACEHGSLQCLQELLEGSPAPLDLEVRNFDGEC